MEYLTYLWNESDLFLINFERFYESLCKCWRTYKNKTHWNLSINLRILTFGKYVVVDLLQFDRTNKVLGRMGKQQIETLRNSNSYLCSGL